MGKKHLLVDSGRKDRRALLALVIGFTVVIAAVYLIGYLTVGERVPRNTSVAGVDIGGLDPDAAAAELRSALAQRELEPIPVSVGDQIFLIDPLTVGLQLDAPATVTAAGGGASLSPARMYRVLFGGAEVHPVVDVDATALEAVLTELAGGVDVPFQEGEIVFDGVRPVHTYPEVGRSVDVDAAARAVRDGFLTTVDAIDLPVEELVPQTTRAQIDTALAELVPALQAGPVVLFFGPDTDPQSSLTISPADYLPTLRIEPEFGELIPVVDGEALRNRLVTALAAVETTPVPARVVIQDGQPAVIPEVPGSTASTAELGAAVERALRSPDRSSPVGLSPVDANFTAADAQALQIQTVVGEFTTPFPHADYRNVNIGRAVELFNGVILRPGEIFSYNQLVGERTAERGFTEGQSIAEGVLVEDLGGGVSQGATTAYNAAFFAGLRDVTHKPHSFYISRYPAGREATVVFPFVDMAFQNDTPYGVLVEAFIQPSTPGTAGAVTVRLWSTPYWTVETETSPRRDITEPGEQRSDAETCVDQSPVPGFTVDVFRHFLDGAGSRQRTERYTTTYQPADEVICS